MYVHDSQKRPNGTFFFWLELTDEERRHLLHKCQHDKTPIAHTDPGGSCDTPDDCGTPCKKQHWQRNLNCDLLEQHTRAMLLLVQEAIQGHESTRLHRDWDQTS